MRTNTALLQSLGRHLEQTAEKRDVDLETLTEQVLTAVKQAVERHFGPRFRFEVRLEQAALEVLQLVRLVETPPGPGEVALAAAPAEWNAQPGDELMLLLPFEPDAARAQDREYAALSGLTIEKSGFVTPVLQAVREVLGVKQPSDPVDEAVLLAMKLTVLPEAAKNDPSQWDSFRLAHDAPRSGEALQALRRRSRPHPRGAERAARTRRPARWCRGRALRRPALARRVAPRTGVVARPALESCRAPRGRGASGGCTIGAPRPRRS